MPRESLSHRSARLSAQAPTRSPPVEALRHREPTTCNGPFFQPTGACNGKRFRPFSSSGVLVQTEALRPANPNKTKRSFLVRPKRFAPREPFPPKRFDFYPFPSRSASLRPAAQTSSPSSGQTGGFFPGRGSKGERFVCNLRPEALRPGNPNKSKRPPF